MIEKVALDAQGVIRVHNILDTKVENREEVNDSLHIQVEGSARLVEAHYRHYRKAVCQNKR